MKKYCALFMAFLLMPLLVSAQKEVEWPDIPLLKIETVDGVDPTATKVYPPEGSVGESIISSHVPGRLVITQKGKGVYDSGDYVKGESGIRIKIRGNTSGANKVQKPYKLKMSKKADLLNISKDLKNKNWALLSHLKTRMKSLETLTAELSKETSIDGVASIGNKMVKRVNIYGMDYTNVNEKELPQNIYRTVCRRNCEEDI